MYQTHIRSDTSVDSGGAKPIHVSDPSSTWLNAHDSGMRNKKVAIMLCTIGNQELPCPLKYELKQNTKLTITQSML